MKLKFRTRSGTWYKVIWDEERRTGAWVRTLTTPVSGKTRLESGTLVTKPVITIGERAILDDDAIRPGYDGHYVYTSEVVVIEHIR